MNLPTMTIECGTSKLEVGKEDTLRLLGILSNAFHPDNYTYSIPQKLAAERIFEWWRAERERSSS